MELKADAGSAPGVCVGGRVLSGRGTELRHADHHPARGQLVRAHHMMR